MKSQVKKDKLHLTLGSAAAVLAVACGWLATELAASKEEARQYRAVGAYAFINGQNEVLEAIHDTRANEERLERYMTPEGLSAFRESLDARMPQLPGSKPRSISLPAVNREAMESVLALASKQSATPN